MPESIFLSVLILFSLLSLIGFAMGLIAWVEIKAMQKSTHSIQYVPADGQFEKITAELNEKLNKDIFENV